MNTPINTQNITIIIVDDDLDIRENTIDLLSTQYNDILAFDSPIPALNHIHQHCPAIVLTDLRMPEGDGLEFTQAIKKIDTELPVILMTGYGDISIAVDAMKHGVYDFIEKPVDADLLLKSINRAVDKRRLSLSLIHTQESLQQHQSIDSLLLGNCSAMKQLKQKLLQLAPLDIPIMIYGETGVGKELVAQCLHDFSPHKAGHFVALNCAAIPDDLAEAELFGYEKGAFTDAKTSHIGKLEYANGGTLFLDEVESLSPSIQAKLLRVLQDRKVTPLGSNQQKTTHFRVISATKDALKNNDNFRQDLFYRLQVGELHIPSLRYREEDILVLFEFFVRQNCKHFKIDYKASNDATIQILLAYDWQGNVRELINVATRYVINGCNDLQSILFHEPQNTQYEHPDHSLKDKLNAYEENLLRSKLAQYSGNVGQVLNDLKIERRTFNQKLARYNISSTDYKK